MSPLGNVDHMRRRVFIVGLGGAAVWPRIARTQSEVPVIGFLTSLGRTDRPEIADAFRRGLRPPGRCILGV